MHDTTTHELDEAERLERLWAGPFGDAYTQRNGAVRRARLGFWSDVVARHGITSALEVGCGVGANLRLLGELLGAHHVVGVDVNDGALAQLHREAPDANAIWGRARDLPFRDGAFDVVVSMGLLIHQPDEALDVVMDEMVRCARRFVLCAEYESPGDEVKPWRGQDRALFKRAYGQRFLARFDGMRRVDGGFLARDTTPFDDVTWHLLAR